jgi:hypothetical protein
MRSATDLGRTQTRRHGSATSLHSHDPIPRFRFDGRRQGFNDPCHVGQLPAGLPGFHRRTQQPRGTAVVESSIPSLMDTWNPVQLACAPQDPGRRRSSDRDGHTPCLGLRYLQSVVITSSTCHPNNDHEDLDKSGPLQAASGEPKTETIPLCPTYLTYAGT